MKIVPTILSDEDVKSMLSMKEAIDLMKTAFQIISEGSSHVPVRMNLPIEPPRGASLLMPSFVPSLNVFGTKIVNVFPENNKLALPAIHSRYLLFDAETGQLKGEMDAEYLTMLRTGAASGLATDLLAKKQASTLAIFGTGGQAESQIEAVCAVRPIQSIYVYARNEQKSEKFCEVIAEKFNKQVLAVNDHKWLAEADVICTATTSSHPVFSHESIKPGVHINGIGSFTSQMAEIPSETVCASKLVVDQKKAALQEAGDITQLIEQGIITEDHIFAELGNLVLGQQTARESDEEITFFKSVGNAIQDIVCANQIIQRALKT